MSAMPLVPPMLRVEMSDATGSLSDYARKARKQPVVVTRRGRPVAALMALSEDDWEDFVVPRHPGFVELLRRSRATCPTGEGIPLDEIKRQHGIRSRTTRRRAAR